MQIGCGLLCPQGDIDNFKLTRSNSSPAGNREEKRRKSSREDEKSVAAAHETAVKCAFD